MKKKALVLAVCMAISTPAASATKSLTNDLLGINLGEIQSQSYLNEPFKGFIPILFTTNKLAEQLNIKIAPASIFLKVGIEKPAVLGKLKFKISSRNNQPVIEIKSREPIHLPFLSFVLEIGTPQGSIYQDYTIMLDPKGLSNNTTLSKYNDISRNSVLPVFYSKNTTPSSQIKLYKIKTGDSLSKIAQKFKVESVSLNKMMEGIQIKNPNAFVDNDINKIRAGVVLTLPTQVDIVTSALSSNTNISKVSQVNTNPTVEPAKPINNQYKVVSGDTLSKITRLYLNENISFTKLMKTIYQENKHAFSKNRINVLKIGSVLNIPVDKEVSKRQINAENKKASSSNITQIKQAKKIEVSSLTIKQNNSLKNSKLREHSTANVVPKLEKRVRELRAELSNVSESTTELESLVIQKELLIQNQKNEISNLQSSLDKYLSNESFNVSAEQELTASKYNELHPQPETLENTIDKTEPSLQKKTIIPTTDAVTVKHSSYIPEGATENWINTQVSEIRKFASAKDLSYGALALILGILWIRYRRELYPYTRITHHSLVKDADVTFKAKQRKKKPITYQNTLVASEEDTLTNNKTYSNSVEIDEDLIQKCEILVDDLLEDLEEDHIYQYDQEPIITNFCASELDILREDKSIESLNLFQEVIDDSKIKDDNAIKGILRELQEDPIKVLNKAPEVDISNIDEWVESISKDSDDVINIDPDKRQRSTV